MSFVRRKELLPQITSLKHLTLLWNNKKLFLRSFDPSFIQLHTSVEHWGSKPHLSKRQRLNSLMSNLKVRQWVVMGYIFDDVFFLKVYHISTTESRSTLTWCSVHAYEITLSMLKQCLALGQRYYTVLYSTIPEPQQGISSMTANDSQWQPPFCPGSVACPGAPAARKAALVSAVELRCFGAEWSSSWLQARHRFLGIRRQNWQRKS